MWLLFFCTPWKHLKTCSKLTIKTPERRHWPRPGIFIVWNRFFDVFKGYIEAWYELMGPCHCVNFITRKPNCTHWQDESWDELSWRTERPFITPHLNYIDIILIKRKTVHSIKKKKKSIQSETALQALIQADFNGSDHFWVQENRHSKELKTRNFIE